MPVVDDLWWVVLTSASGGAGVGTILPFYFGEYYLFVIISSGVENLSLSFISVENLGLSGVGAHLWDLFTWLYTFGTFLAGV